MPLSVRCRCTIVVSVATPPVPGALSLAGHIGSAAEGSQGGPQVQTTGQGQGDGAG